MNQQPNSNKDKRLEATDSLPGEVRHLFAAAIRLPMAKRAEFLARSCKNSEVRLEVEELLDWDQRESSPLDAGCLAFIKNEFRPPDFAFGDLQGYSNLVFLSEGGQAVIYKAKQNSTNQTVVIKALKNGDDGNASRIARLKKEIAILSKLQHPNIVAIIDSGTTERGQDYYVSRFITGHDLDDYLAKESLSLGRKLELCGRIAKAVHAAHEAGIIHRDLKPSNIRIDRHGEPHVLDFGLAKGTIGQEIESSELKTKQGSFLGSILWASPEQIDPKFGQVGKPTDAYQLGIVFFQVFSNGRLPYEFSDNCIDNFHQIIHSQPKRLSSIMGPEFQVLDEALAKAIAKHPSDRYATPLEFIEALLLCSHQNSKRRESRRSLGLLRNASIVVLVGAVMAGFWIYLGYGDDVRRRLPPWLTQSDNTDIPVTEGATNSPRSAASGAAVANETESNAVGPNSAELNVAESSVVEPTEKADSPINEIAESEQLDRPFLAEEAPAGESLKTKPANNFLPMLKSIAGHFDFLNTKPGFLPSDWEAEGAIGIDSSNGIPGMGIRGLGSPEYRISSDAVKLGGDFFLEYQITDVTYDSVITRLSSSSTGDQLEFEVIASRNTDWTVKCGPNTETGVATRSLNDLWIRVEHTEAGVFLLTNGDATSRRRISDPFTCQFDSVLLEFPRKMPGMQIRMLRWGALERHQPLPTSPHQAAPARNVRNLPPQGWTAQGSLTDPKPLRLISPHLQLGREFSVQLSVDRENLSYAQYVVVLRGQGSSTTVPIQFQYHRGWLSIYLGNSKHLLDHTIIPNDEIRIERAQDRLLVIYGAEEHAVSMDASHLGTFDEIHLEVLRQDREFYFQDFPSVHLVNEN